MEYDDDDVLLYAIAAIKKTQCLDAELMDGWYINGGWIKRKMIQQSITTQEKRSMMQQLT
jgi:hypothetical protein